MLVSCHYYRPQRSCGKVMFLHLSVSHSVHKGVYPSMYWGRHPPGQTYPSMHWDRHNPPGRHIPACPGADTPLADISQHALGQTPSPGHTYPSMHWDRPPPPNSHCSGRFASYWNAFLFKINS